MNSVTCFAATSMLGVVLAPLGASARDGCLIFKLLPDDGMYDDQFGRAVAIGGGVAIVGMTGTDVLGDYWGAAYLFDAATARQLHKLELPDAGNFNMFGWSVGVDGSVVIVGDPYDDTYHIQSGSAYFFDLRTGEELFRLRSDPGFGSSVAISGDTAIVGSPYDDDNGAYSGSAYLFDIVTGHEIAKLLPADGAPYDWFGTSVAISGDTALVGAPLDSYHHSDSGSAYLFDVATGQEIAKLLPGDGAPADPFGKSVAISGDTAIVGAYGDDANSTDSGSAYLFDVATGNEIAKLRPSDGAPYDWFGYSVAISNDTAIVGAPVDSYRGSGPGSVYLFDVATGRQLAKLLPADGAPFDRFGYSAAISDDTAIVGAPWDDDNGMTSGSAYLFDIGCVCPADFNGDGTVNSQDFILFLNLFVAQDPAADFNGDGVISSQDFIVFLSAFIAGC